MNAVLFFLATVGIFGAS